MTNIGSARLIGTFLKLCMMASATSCTDTCSCYDSALFNKCLSGNDHDFSAVHINTRSIKNRRDEIDLFYNSLSISFDVMLFTETWLTDNDEPSFFRKYRYTGLNRKDKRGGGVAIYIKDNLSFHVIEDFSLLSPHAESLLVHLGSLLVAVVYRPPSGDMSTFLSFLGDMLDFLCGTGLPFFIMGDVNINSIGNDIHAADLLNLLASCGCSNKIKLPTRITAESATSLDCCLTNLNSNDVRTGILLSDMSDHLPIFCLSSTKFKRTRHHESFLYRRIDEQSLNNFRFVVENTNWDDPQSKKNPLVEHRERYGREIIGTLTINAVR